MTRRLASAAPKKIQTFKRPKQPKGPVIWRPSEGRGGIVPEGVTGLRNAADGVWDPDKAREKGEIAVFREDLGFGAAALVPGEGVWFEESLDAVDRAAGTAVDSINTADTAHKSATPSDGPPSAPAATR